MIGTRQWLTRSRRSSTPCRGRGRRPGGRRCSAASPAATSGPAAACRFCATDFVGTDGAGGGRFPDAGALAAAIARAWEGGPAHRYVVFTGGEPLLQLDAPLIAAVHAEAFAIAIETNGTLPAPPGIDWICVSPKGGNRLAQAGGNELKLVYPQAGADPERFVGLRFRHRSLQPMDGPDRTASTQAAIAYCRRDARWRLSLQTHKVVGIP